MARETKEQVASFSVEINGEDEIASRCHLDGTYEVVVLDRSMCLCDPDTKETLYEWEYTRIKQYRANTSRFTLEIGLGCSSGQGTFYMKTTNGYKMVETVQTCVRRMKEEQKLEKKEAQARRDALRDRVTESRGQDTVQRTRDTQDVPSAQNWVQPLDNTRSRAFDVRELGQGAALKKPDSTRHRRCPTGQNYAPLSSHTRAIIRNDYLTIGSQAVADERESKVKQSKVKPGCPKAEDLDYGYVQSISAEEYTGLRN